MSERSQHLVSSAFFLVLSALFSYVLVASKFFPFSSISFVLITCAFLVFIFKKERTKHDYFWFSFALGFSSFLILRSNPFLTFVNLCAAFFSTSLLAMPRGSINSIVNFIFSPLIVFVKSALTKNKYSLVSLFESRVDTKLFNGYSIAASIILLVIIVPLLASANPIFSKLISDTFGSLLKDSIGIHVVRLILFIVFAIFIPKVISFVSSESSTSKNESEMDLTLLLPKVIVIGVLLVFFVTQIQLYLASAGTLAALGYSHSQYAREVFGQLFIVSFAIIGLIFVDKNHSKKDWIMTAILLAEGFFLCAIAFKSVNDYATTWGFTSKRLWGYAGATFIFGTYGLLTFAHIKKLLHQSVLKEIVIWAGLILLTVNVVNFDYVIYHFSKAKTQSGIDYSYLSGLSPDAHSYKDHLANIFGPVGNMTSNLDINSPNIYSTYRILDQVGYLQRKYNGSDWRSFNLSEYLEYKDVQNIDVAKYAGELQKSDTRLNPAPTPTPR